MRGKDAFGHVSAEELGITPAYAGKRALYLRRLFIYEDHPRICGEKFPFCRADCLCSGITPAYAGKSGKRYRKTSSSRDHPRICGEKGQHAARACRNNLDHPRICGEKDFLQLGFVCFPGSPPHMRGKAGIKTATETARGITPAYAGKSCYTSSDCMPQWDHPRICGEKTKKIP